MKSSFLALVVLLLASGCSSAPSTANIALRKSNSDLQDQVANLQRQRDADQAQIVALQNRQPTTEMLSQQRLEKLYTVQGIKFCRLTGGSTLSDSREYDSGLHVSVVPIDDDGQSIKAAGSVAIEAFDLSAPAHVRIGRWLFTTEQARASWLGEALLYNFVFDCPWQTRPNHPSLTIKVTFTDELTGRQFTTQTQVQVRPPPTESVSH
jgi:hypothetical protein